jgi:hypothetical protein
MKFDPLMFLKEHDLKFKLNGHDLVRDKNKNNLKSFLFYFSYHSFYISSGLKFEFRVLTGSSGIPNQFFFLKKIKMILF